MNKFEHLDNEMEEILTISPEELNCICRIREKIISKLGGTVLSDIVDITKNRLTISLEISKLGRTEYVDIDRKKLEMIIN